jgi:hypothetical protein
MEDGITVNLDPIVKKPTVLGLNVTIAPDAPPGAHKITLIVGKQSFPQEQTFFVQIPSSLAGASFDGTFDKIGPGGAGNLHTPNFGPNDFVFDASGTRVDTDDKAPVCGVYRNYAFQLMDQDSPPHEIRAEGLIVTENINPGSPIAAATNNAGQILDTHALVSPDHCISANVFADVTQSFIVDVTGKPFSLTTTMHIVVGNVNGKLNETTEVTHQ